VHPPYIPLSFCQSSYFSHTNLYKVIFEWQENYINYKPVSIGKDESGVKRMKALARAAESISDGDIVNVQIRRYRQWQLSQASSFASSIVP
jgi:replication factor C subunit 1